VVLMSLIASHHDLDLAVLERLSADAHALGRDVVADCAPVSGAVVLATCNRFEVYLDVDDAAHAPDARTAVARAVADRSGYTADHVLTHLRADTGADVAAHLFSVASGLESMVVGEREISGQVRRALAAARRDATTTSDLERLFQQASRTSRAVGSQTGLGAAGRSVVGVALDLVEDGLPAWPDVRCVLVGTGSYAGASLAALKARGVGEVHVYSASSHQRAAAFATARGVRSVGPDDLDTVLAEAHLVVACSGAQAPILQVDALAVARAGSTHPLAVVDLALRHDVDPDVRSLPGVRLVSLATVSEHAPDEHSLPVEQARGIVAEAARTFEADRRMRDWWPAVVAERTRVLGGLEHALTTPADGAAAVTDERTARAVRRRARSQLHGPTVRARIAAREGDAAAYTDALAEFVQIGVPAVG